MSDDRTPEYPTRDDMRGIRTVGDLIEALRRFDPATPVRGTWESIAPEIASVYYINSPEDHGCVLVDVDGDFYRKTYEQTDEATLARVRAPAPHYLSWSEVAALCRAPCGLRDHDMLSEARIAAEKLR